MVRVAHLKIVGRRSTLSFFSSARRRTDIVSAVSSKLRVRVTHEKKSALRKGDMKN